jgi:hypothetical protein
MDKLMSKIEGMMLGACSAIALLGLMMFLLQHDFSPPPVSPGATSGVLRVRATDAYAGGRLIIGKQDIRYYDDTAGYTRMD